MDFLKILRTYRVPYREGGTHHHVTKDYVGVDCPRCSPGQGKWKAGYHLSRHYLTCWTCGHLPLVETLSSLTGLPFSEVRSLLGPLERPRSLPRAKGRLTLPKGLGPLLEPHRAYLRGRGLDPDALERVWGVGGLGVAGRLSWRVFLPIHQDGKVVSWTTRTIGTMTPRYITAGAQEEDVSSKNLLYGGDFLRHAVVVCEGPMDALRVGPGAAAVMGVVVSTSQVRRIAQCPVRAVCFDSEPGAQRRARRLCDDLEVFGGRTANVVLQTGKDPGEARESELRQLRKCFLGE